MMFSCVLRWCVFFFFKQKTAYEMRISDWSSDVCSSDLAAHQRRMLPRARIGRASEGQPQLSRRGGAVRALTNTVIARSEATRQSREIGRASCRERVCQYV